MASRLNLHEELVNALGSRNVYFQPPTSLKMKYPCIIYKRSNAKIDYANNKTYLFKKAYEVTVVDQNPDSAIVDRLFTALPLTRYNRHFTADNLNHDVFTIYY